MIAINPEAFPRLLVAGLLLALWLAVCYVYGRWWTWKTNMKRRAGYRRRRGR